jgi:L-threonylcarbamoyladenylate synthase
MNIQAFSPEVLDRACHLLARGDVVAIPTETVYGLAADATNDQAVAKIYAVKQRPEFNPLIIHCHSAQQAKQYVEFDGRAEKLADLFWPGPVTFVLKRKQDSEISLLASSGLDTLAVRIPAHPMAQALIKAYSKPLAAPSANLSQTISPTSALDVQASLGTKVPLIIDGGQYKELVLNRQSLILVKRSP